MGSTIPRRRLYSNRPLRLSIRAFIAVACGCRSLALLPSKKGAARTSSSTRGYRVFLSWAKTRALPTDFGFCISSRYVLDRTVRGFYYCRPRIAEVDFQFVAFAIQAWFEACQCGANLLAVAPKHFDSTRL